MEREEGETRGFWTFLVLVEPHFVSPHDLSHSWILCPKVFFSFPLIAVTFTPSEVVLTENLIYITHNYTCADIKYDSRSQEFLILGTAVLLFLLGSSPT